LEDESQRSLGALVPVFIPDGPRAQSEKDADSFVARLQQDNESIIGMYWHGTYPDGWFNGGMTLWRNLISSPPTDEDSNGLILPMLYCFRHYLELQSKRLIELGSQLLMQAPPKLTEHRLSCLFQRLRPMLEAVKRPPDEIAFCRLVFSDFARSDDSSQTMRYFFDLKGETNWNRLPVPQQHFGEAMMEIHDILENVYESWAVAIDDRRL